MFPNGLNLSGGGLKAISIPGVNGSLAPTSTDLFNQLQSVGARNAANDASIKAANDGFDAYAAQNMPSTSQYAAAHAPAATGNAGSSGGTTNYAQQQASAAAAANATRLANAQTNVNDSMGNILNNFGTNAALNNANVYRGQIDTNLGQLATSQNQINSTRQNAQLNRQMSVTDLANTLRAGLQSTGVQLGNQNALDSSAAEGAAKGYGQYGASQTNNINGQANLALTQADQAQGAQDAQQQTMEGSLQAQKANAIQSIQSNLGTYLKQLDDQAQAEGLHPLDYNGHIQSVVDDANNKLSALDSYFSQQKQGASYQRVSNDQAAQQAYDSFQKNNVPQNASLYSFNSAPVTGQGVPVTPGGAPTVQLPLYTARKTG